MWEIIRYYDITTVKLIAAISYITWAIWAFVAVIFWPGTELVHHTILNIQPLAFWGWVFLFQGSWALLQLQRTTSKIQREICAISGVVLWTSSTGMILGESLLNNELPWGSGHWIMVAITWWILLRELITKKI
jgi:hypothetical protein